MDLFGFALYLAQDGRKHEQTKPLKGFGSADVLEVVEDWDRSTYRAVYTVRFEKGGVCTACVSKEGQTRSRHTEGGYRLDPRAPEGCGADG